MPRDASQRRRVGDLRPSQLLYTSGIGSVVELPNLSVMVMGLDDWPIERSAVVNEPRLLRAVKQELGDQVEKLLSPPSTPDSIGYRASPFEDTASVGVPVAPFPRWLVCPFCRLLAPIHSDLFELKLDPYRKDRSRYVHRVCKKPGKPPTAVPARFLVACEHGHVDDFPWVQYVHRKKQGCRYQLQLYELGATGEVADIQVECVKCGLKRRMSEAFTEQGKIELSTCRGRWPHLRNYAPDTCREAQRSILLGASNSWFPVTLSALSIPSTADKLGQLVDQNWAELEECESAREVMLKNKLLRGLSAYTEDQIWDAVQKRKAGGGAEDNNALELRDPEWGVFSNPDPAFTTRDFVLRAVEPPADYKKVLKKVVLAERLREVRSLIGFTRIESPGDYSEFNELPSERRVGLSRSAPKWVPAADVRGEGVFLQFEESAIEEWAAKLGALDDEFFRAHQRWRSLRGLDPNQGFPRIRYVLLHSLARVDTTVFP